MHPFAGARWIGADKDCPSPQIFRRFHAATPLSASLTITGLGYFIPRLNGMPVTDCRLQPVYSEYARRDLRELLYPLHDQVTPRIYYLVYEVGHLIRTGGNLLSIHLGNGWYRQEERIAEGHLSYGDTLKPIYRLTLRYSDRTIDILSDGSETWQESQVRYNNLFIGEIHDLGSNPGAERPVQVLPEEKALLSPQTAPPDKVIRRIRPRLLREYDGVRIYDAGENISGVVRLTAAGKPGEKITLRYAEELRGDGLDFGSTGGGYVCASGRQQVQTDICICGDSPQTFEPLFCWHGFRYFSMEGPGREPEVLVIHADTPVTGDFFLRQRGHELSVPGFSSYPAEQYARRHPL